MMLKFKRDEIMSDLRDHVAEVLFKKIDGTQRRMRCTLMPNHLPGNFNSDHLHEVAQREENLETVVCWDIDANAWKSFRVENVEYCSILDNY